MADIIEKRKEGFVLLHLDGDFTGGDETDELKSKLIELAQIKGNKLLVDLSGVSYLSTIALGAFLTANKRLNENNCKLVLCNPNTYLKDIFRTTKLSTVISIADSFNDGKDILGV